MEPYRYAGHELDVFRHATNWKAYFASQIADDLRGDVLEVGGGLGATTQALCDGRQASWTCLEPDEALRAALARNVAGLPLPVIVRGGTTGDLPQARAYDCVLYVDVLEHIEDDATELARAARLLRPGGRIVVLSPAHQRLFSEFDRAIGHYRRYDAGMLRRITPPGATLTTLRYLDSAGLVLSAGNRLVLRSGRPTVRQIQLWDRWFVAASRRIDPALRWRIGKSVLAVWRV
jgi:SAM-dependent methyltransferase